MTKAFCTKCSNKLEEGAAFCGGCGTPCESVAEAVASLPSTDVSPSANVAPVPEKVAPAAVNTSASTAASASPSQASKGKMSPVKLVLLIIGGVFAFLFFGIIAIGVLSSLGDEEEGGEATDTGAAQSSTEADTGESAMTQKKIFQTKTLYLYYLGISGKPLILHLKQGQIFIVFFLLIRPKKKKIRHLKMVVFA